MTPPRSRPQDRRSPEHPATATPTGQPRVLVAIANHGTSKQRELQRLLATYRSMTYPCDLVVLSDAPKDLGADVEVLVGAPTRDPWSLPFGHRRLFAERRDDYDLFVYSEDDHLVTEAHLRAFLDTVDVVADGDIPGFMRYELAADGERWLHTMHSGYRWDPDSAYLSQGLLFAHHTNEHAACTVMTRRHLDLAIRSGGYLVAPHRGKYDMLVTAATDLYTQCGLRKVVCVSRLDDFLVHHLPDKYVRVFGTPEHLVRPQLAALREIAAGRRPARTLLRTETAAGEGTLSKSYTEHRGDALVALLDVPVDRALVVGTGSVLREQQLLGDAAEITCIPLDSVVSATAEQAGLETLTPDLPTALQQLDGRRFPCILMVDLLHRWPDPAHVLRGLAPHLEPAGVVLLSIPNGPAHRLRALWHDRRLPRFRFARTGLHLSGRGRLRRWLLDAGYRAVEIRPDPACQVALPRWLPAWLRPVWPAWLRSTELLAVAQAPADRAPAATAADRTVQPAPPRPPGAAVGSGDGRGRDYVLITPARDEADGLAATIAAVVAQREQPRRWVIVSDGSTDGTDAIVAEHAARHPFIHLLRREPDGAGGFASKVAAFAAGYDLARQVPHEFVGNLDADVEPPPEYFTRVLDAFAAEPDLGLAGGQIHVRTGTTTRPQRISRGSVAGAVALYRRACFEQVGGFVPLSLGGEDSAAEIHARYHTWAVRTLADLPVTHRGAITHGARGVLAARFRKGRTNRALGYDPVFHLAVSAFRAFEPPYLVGGVAMALGYAWATLRRQRFALPAAVVAFLRGEQRRRLVAIITRRAGLLDDPAAAPDLRGTPPLPPEPTCAA